MNLISIDKNTIDILNNMPLGVIWLLKKKIVFINKRGLEFTKLKISNNFKDIDYQDVFTDDTINKIEKLSLALENNKKANSKNFVEIKLDTEKFLKIEASITKINYNKKRVLQLILYPKAQPTKPLKQDNLLGIQSELRKKENQLNTILETSNHLIWTVNNKFELTGFNKNFSDLIYQKYKFKIGIGCNISALLTKEVKAYTTYWHPKYNQVFKGKKLVFIKEEVHKKYICRQVFINPVYDENKKVNEICCVAHDITDSVLYERKVNSQKGRLTAIFDSSQHYIWTIDKMERLTSFNKNYFDLVTDLYHTQPYVGLILNRGILANDHQYTGLLKEHYQKAFSGVATNFEIEVQDNNNSNIFLEIFLNPIYNKNEVVEVSGIAHNITDKKTVHQKMEISLKEKEVLLKEVHHRVKNNMQVISSILNLQSFYVKDNYTLGLLKESQNRISTMAYIHESLYQNNSFSSVNFSEYIKRLIRNIIASYSFNAENIELKQEIDEIALSLDTAIPLGLIINELMTNSIKHAFNDRNNGTIIINLKTENNYVFLSLMDDGIGLEEGFNIENSQSLGLQLVSTLIEQIGAKYNLVSKKNQGTKFNISFQI